MPGKIETVAWDTCIFLAWLNGENRAAGEMEGVEQNLAKIEAGECNLVAASLIHAEIRQARLSDDARQKLEGFLKRSNVEVAAGTAPVMQLAGELCQYYDQQKLTDGLPPLGMPDAIHLATGIIYQVKAFYTFDKRGNPRWRGLIPLSGNVAGHPLTICTPPYTPPPPTQIKLF